MTQKPSGTYFYFKYLCLMVHNISLTIFLTNKTLMHKKTIYFYRKIKIIFLINFYL